MWGNDVAQHAVVAENLTKRFGDVVALDGLNLSISAGTIYGVIGPNGAGKSTFMRILCDVVRPTSGNVRVLGEDPLVGGPDLRARIGYLPGEFRVGGNLTGAQLIRYWAGMSVHRDNAIARARELSEFIGFDENRKIGELSKGNKQKLGIVQAFMHSPELLILDEPTSGLDPLVQEQFLQLVTDVHARGSTVFLSSHVLSEIERVADRAAILRSGQVVREGTLTELHEHSVRHLRAVVVGNLSEVEQSIAQSGLELTATDVGDRVLLEGTTTGQTGRVLALLAQLQIDDFTYTEPDLSQSVIDIYEGKL